MPNDFSQGFLHDVPLDGALNPYLSGEIDFAVLRIEKDGTQNLTIRGWIVNPDDPIVNLQIGIPGCRLSFAKWIERFDLEHSSVENFFRYGFQATLSKNDLSAQLDSLSFIATLGSGLSKVGIFALPDVRVQKVPRYSADARSHSSQTESITVPNTGRLLDQVQVEPSVEVKVFTPPSENRINTTDALRKNHFAHWQDRLKAFLNSSITYELPNVAKPQVSIIIPVHNKAELTYGCLLSIISSSYTSYEVIVVDNDSTDKTSELLRKFKGLKVLYNETNLHYLRGINFGCRYALGNVLLFLNNDTILDPAAITCAVQTLVSNPECGAVGGRIISFDSTLQEAGSMLLADGSSYAYGIGEDPWDYKYLFERDVDYCSGSFLLTGKDTFIEHGGFDERYAPAYYEEVDYCVRLQEAGKKIIYQPRSVIFHLEHGSAPKSEVVKQQTKNRAIFVDLRKNFLSKAPNIVESVLRLGRGLSDQRKRVLFVDDRIPFMEAGAGFPRTSKIIQDLVDCDVDLTFYPIKSSPASYNDIYQAVPPCVELVLSSGEAGLESLIKKRFNYYDIILISRPHNLEIWNRIKQGLRLENLRSKLVYDAESIFSLREIAKIDQAKSLQLTDKEREYIISKEIDLAADFDHITVVSERDLKLIKAKGIKSAGILSYGVNPDITGRIFSERQDLIFVGPLLQENCPNVDGLNWFIEEVFPLVKMKLGKVIGLTVVGVKNSHLLVNSNGINFQGPVSQVKPFYDVHRIAIAPMRIAAGISIKTIEAASFGIPIITTERIAQLMNWKNDTIKFYSDNADEYASIIAEVYMNQLLWEEIRALQIHKVSEEFSNLKFKSEIQNILAKF